MYSPYLKGIVRKCLVKEPSKRASVYDLAKILEEKVGKFDAEPENIKEIKPIEAEQGLIISQN